MTLTLHHLYEAHSALRGYPTDLVRLGGLALQREGHDSPAQTAVNHDGLKSTVEIEWISQDLAMLKVVDDNRVTEDGAEAVALSYANSTEGWVVKRRLQRGESADWLLRNGAKWLALEVSGMRTGDPSVRLQEKTKQVARCTLPADRLAIVVAFETPLLMAGIPS